MKITPIDAPIIRKDTTVGTRIFAGDVMIFGDLPWRNISHLLEPGWTGDVYVQRSATLLTFRVNALTAAAGAGTTVMRTPLGLRPLTYATTARWELPIASTPAQYWRGQFSAGGSLTVLAIPTSPLYGDFSLPADPQWLAELP
ncbi:minor tail protein [Corynebacterium phage PSonyx]|nr:minor tail protein [Corynebacterium phage PSonyx]